MSTHYLSQSSTQQSPQFSTRSILVHIALFVSAIFWLGGCGGGEESVDTSSCTTAEVSYDVHIKPLIANNCLGCHSASLSGEERNNAPSSANFESYADLEGYRLDMVTRVVAGAMPAENTDLGTGPLSQDKRDCFAAWRDADFRESAP